MIAAIARSRRFRLAFGAAMPFLVILILPALGGWAPAIPDLAVYSPESSSAPAILSELSSDLNVTAIAIIVACGIILKEWGGANSKSFWTACVVVVSACVGSCYAGVRFRFALAEQVSIMPLDLGLIGDRLAAQGLLLLLAVSGLLYMTLITFLTPSPEVTVERKASKPQRRRQ